MGLPRWVAEPGGDLVPHGSHCTNPHTYCNDAYALEHRAVQGTGASWLDLLMIHDSAHGMRSTAYLPPCIHGVMQYVHASTIMSYAISGCGNCLVKLLHLCDARGLPLVKRPCAQQQGSLQHNAPAAVIGVRYPCNPANAMVAHYACKPGCVATVQRQCKHRLHSRYDRCHAATRAIGHTCSLLFSQSASICILMHQ